MVPTPADIVATIGVAVDGEAWWPVHLAYHEARGTDPRDEIAIGAVLVQNTAWQQVERALERIADAGALSLDGVADLPLGHLTDLVRPAGFVQRKPRTLQELARTVQAEGGMRLLAESVKDDPDPARETLLEVHGVGPETADAILLYALDAPVFVVDAYTRRLMARLHVTPSDGHPDPTTAPYPAIANWWRAGLARQAHVYRHAHAAIVHHAQTVCRKVPDCPRCPLHAVCPTAA